MDWMGTRGNRTCDLLGCEVERVLDEEGGTLTASPPPPGGWNFLTYLLLSGCLLAYLLVRSGLSCRCACLRLVSSRMAALWRLCGWLGTGGCRL